MRFSKCALLLIFSPSVAFCQQADSVGVVNNKRVRTMAVSGSVVYASTLAGLSHLWYADSESQPFQFFDDNSEWKQIDKVGHFYSAFYLSYGTSRALQWSGVQRQKSDLVGSLVGFGIMLPIEILDGFSKDYGASTGDLIANAAGSAFFLGQSRLWNEVRIYPKFSFHRTDYAQLRSDLLGNDLTSEILKDYNGQTFWLSADIDKFLRFPKWLNLAVGYGADGMIYARDYQNVAAGYPRPYRQYYFSIDFDLSSIKSHSKVINTILFFANMVKIPAPAISFSKTEVKFHPFYF